MADVMVIQGRHLSDSDLDWMRNLMVTHPEWGRTRISVELCRQWGWHNQQGRPKDMAARSLLLKLERAGHFRLPRRRTNTSRGFHDRIVPLVAHATDPIRDKLCMLQPLAVSVVTPGTEALRLFNCLLHRYHYLGHRNTVGENLRYLVCDRLGRPVACALFGSAAWKCAARDVWIGWDRGARERNLQGLTNNTRFLVLPWVRVPHLASHVLGLIARRIRVDWQSKYGHPIHALETFVDRDRFRGTCYQAANWMRLGSTQGRTRNDRNHCIRTSVKDVYLYPFSPDFRRELCA
jgi:hypothetical protein